MSEFKYFTFDEVVGLENPLVGMLDYARLVYGLPIKITSGYRSPEHNASIGGVSDSAHTKGLAADLAKPEDIGSLLKMVWALGLAGFNRIEIATKHVHVDIDSTKPSPVMWFGESK